MAAVAGSVAVLKIGSTTAPGQDWKLDLDAKAKDISTFSSGRQRVGTLPDGKLTFKLIVDDASQPTDTGGLNLRLGTAITAKCYVSATSFWIFPGIVTKLTPHVTGLEDVAMSDVELDQSGTITYPV